MGDGVPQSVPSVGRVCDGVAGDRPRVRPDGDGHRASDASSRPSASGSSPCTRSIQVPSSAATSAVKDDAVVMGRDRCEAAAADDGDAPSLRLHSPPRLRIVGDRDELFLAEADLHRERALSGLGKHHVRLDAHADLTGEAEPIEPAGGEHDGVEATLDPLAEARVDVPTKRLDGEARLEREKLGPPSDGRGADPHARLDRSRPAERVTRVLARRVSADDQAGHVGRRHVLRGVDGDVDPALEERLLELLHEHAAAADLAERARPVAVARGCDRNQGDLDPRPSQRLDRALGLGEREPTAARADANQHDSGGRWRSPERRTHARHAAGCGRTRSG